MLSLFQSKTGDRAAPQGVSASQREDLWRFPASFFFFFSDCAQFDSRLHPDFYLGSGGGMSVARWRRLQVFVSEAVPNLEVNV